MSSLIFITEDKKYLVKKKDELNYMLMVEKTQQEGSEKKEFDENKPNDTHRNLGYYSCVGDAMKAYTKKAAGDNVSNVDEYVQRMEQILLEIKSIFK